MEVTHCRANIPSVTNGIELRPQQRRKLQLGPQLRQVIFDDDLQRCVELCPRSLQDFSEV
eukprot:CAMPEP_0179026860 /NCGR_PEP_ID=MMETSP0796-20121207/8737_1 /TAXON_ID=73915 /ORGANISM="Pyrodinium bahamense, Strain pbaha01" /LENGTH=59 /DNA_ID=CAMNT_0020722963 /DNA_START=649 /DNA_END=828 /DNA_ORIENTATION=-